MLITNNLRNILKEKDLMQKDLAKLIEVDVYKASRLVRADRFTVVEVEDLCRALEITPNDLFAYEK